MVNFRELQQQQQLNRPLSTLSLEKQLSALLRVGQAVNLAVERFVVVGETIAYENATIKIDMLDACREARQAGMAIKYQTQQPGTLIINTPNTHSSAAAAAATLINNDKISLIQAANDLMNAVTKVLLLADVVIINQILNAKNKVVFFLLNSYLIRIFIIFTTTTTKLKRLG